MPVRFKGGGASGGGGGAATVVWGPDFGTEDDLVMAAAASMPSVALAGLVTQAGAVSLPNVKLAGGVTMGGAVSHAERLTGAATMGGAASHAHALAGLASQGGLVSMPLVSLRGGPTQAGAPSMPTVGLLGAATMAGNPGGTHTTSAIVAQKDSWCDVITACPVNLNRDATDLQAEGVTATRKDMIFGWDLSGFPTGATVTSATVTFGLKTAPTASDTMQLYTISDANESWSETTVKCSTIPATVDEVGNFVIGTTAGPRDVSSALDAVGRSRIAARMGVGAFSLRALGAGLTLTNCVFESADEGTNNALGPRLSFTWSFT